MRIDVDAAGRRTYVLRKVWDGFGNSWWALPGAGDRAPGRQFDREIR